jgi:23S rRNA (pseudouridine1915-N3)-methyltransferase
MIRDIQIYYYYFCMKGWNIINKWILIIPMKIALLQIGKTNEKYVSDGVEEYSRRIRKYSGFEIITIPELRNTKNMPVAEQKLKEGEKILNHLSVEDYVILLDEKGKEFSTKEFSLQLEKIFMLQVKRIVFVIGGPFGFSVEAYKRGDLRLSLSRFTFSHQLVRLLFAEQLYRIFTVIRGEPYHHE